MLKRCLLPIVVAVFCAATAWGTSLEVALNDFSAQGRFVQPLVEDSYGTSELAFRLLYNDHKDLTLGSAGFNFLGKPGNVPGLDLGVGVQVSGARSTDGAVDQDLVSVGLGLLGQFNPPVLQGLGFGARVFYGPKILAFADSEGLFEGAASVGYAITPKIRVFTEYQYLHARFEDIGNGSIDEGLRLGFQAKF